MADCLVTGHYLMGESVRRKERAWANRGGPMTFVHRKEPLGHIRELCQVGMGKGGKVSESLFNKGECQENLNTASIFCQDLLSSR